MRFLPSAKCSLRRTRFNMLRCLFLALIPCFAFVAWAGVGGNISGTVRDSSGAVVSKATVTVTNTDTGVAQTVSSDDKGAYSFLNLPVGHYNLAVTLAGFKPYKLSGVVVNVNDALLIDPDLQVGQKNDSVSVSDNATPVSYTHLDVYKRQR